MTSGTGWIGTQQQLKNFLDVAGADRDEEGRFKVGGSITSFMGAGDEYVVGDDAYYLSGGQKCSLAGGLRTTSYGLSITVIA